MSSPTSDYGGFGSDTYEPQEPFIEPNHSKEWVRFDGEGEPGELIFSVRSRTRPIRYVVTIRKLKCGEHERGEAACACEAAWFKYNPHRPTVVGAVCWHVRQILKIARRA